MPGTACCAENSPRQACGCGPCSSLQAARWRRSLWTMLPEPRPAAEQADPFVVRGAAMLSDGIDEGGVVIAHRSHPAGHFVPTHRRARFGQYCQGVVGGGDARVQPCAGGVVTEYHGLAMVDLLQPTGGLGGDNRGGEHPPLRVAIGA